MDAETELERLLDRVRTGLCEHAGVEPLPVDEARDQATALMAVLLPAFEVTFRAALSGARSTPVTHARRADVP